MICKLLQNLYQYAGIHIYERSSKDWASGQACDVEAPSSLRSRW